MHVIMHNAASVDGRIDGFDPDIGLYYGLAENWDIDAHLVGADTLIEGQQGADAADVDWDVGIESVESEYSPSDGIEPNPPDDREETPSANHGATSPPVLVVIDSKGRVSEWKTLADQPFWCDILVLCAEVTPEEYRQTLETQGISSLVVGDDRVDLPTAMDELANRGFETVLVDSGGTLTGALLQEGLIDELSVLVHPVVIGGTSSRSFIRGPDPQVGPTQLRLQSVEEPAPDIVWLRYTVRG